MLFSIIAIVAGVFVGLINILLNIRIRIAAKSSNTFVESILSYEFLIAFMIGTLSITFMMVFYHNATKFNLSQALMLMASSSIIFGTLIDKFYYKNSIPMIDLMILLIIISVYTYKFTLKT